MRRCRPTLTRPRSTALEGVWARRESTGARLNCRIPGYRSKDGKMGIASRGDITLTQAFPLLQSCTPCAETPWSCTRS